MVARREMFLEARLLVVRRAFVPRAGSQCIALRFSGSLTLSGRVWRRLKEIMPVPRGEGDSR